MINDKWKKLMIKIDKSIFIETQTFYNNKMNEELEIFPYYHNVFNFTNFCFLDKVKIVIIGQDPYHGLFFNFTEKEFIPEKTGLSFSVPIGCKIPPSLLSIFKNLIKYNHIERMPDNGSLERWSQQGVLLLNSALTVEKKNPNCHQKQWKKFTDNIVKEIAQYKNNLIFIVWEKEANNKTDAITNKESHKFIISSHPSGLSANKPFGEHKSFNNTDCFGLANEYLEEMGLEKIIW